MKILTNIILSGTQGVGSSENKVSLMTTRVDEAGFNHFFCWCFLDALASLDSKLWVSDLPFSASASTGLSDYFFWVAWLICRYAFYLLPAALTIDRGDESVWFVCRPPLRSILNQHQTTQAQKQYKKQQTEDSSQQYWIIPGNICLGCHGHRWGAFKNFCWINIRQDKRRNKTTNNRQNTTDGREQTAF